MNKIFITTIIISCCFCSGCKVETAFNILNTTNKTIYLLSGHTKITTKIKANEAKDIPHTIGSLTISIEGGPVWEYENISVPDMNETKYLERGNKGPFTNTLKIYLLLDKEGSIFILPKDNKDKSDYMSTQPTGFPLVPCSVQKLIRR